MEPALQALELGQQPAVTVDHAEATHAEAAGQEAEVERLDRDRAAGLSLQLPDRQLPDEHRQGDDHGRAQDEDDDHDQWACFVIYLIEIVWHNPTCSAGRGCAP